MAWQGYVRLLMSLSWSFLFMAYPTQSTGLMEPVNVRIRFTGWDKDEMKFDLTVEDN